jgi:chromosome segregation ATPase
MSWLNSTMNDPSISPLVSEIARLQRELDDANQSIDEKLEQLEDAGLDAVNLTRQLEDGRIRIVTLENEVARLSRKDDRRTRRLKKTRCLKCRTKVDFENIDGDSRCVSQLPYLIFIQWN